MLKKIHLHIFLLTLGENGEDRISASAEGFCTVEKSGVMLRYPEPENEGHARLLLADGLADLRRCGLITSRLTFIEGRLLPCPYQTPHGALAFSVFTHSQSFTLDACGGCFRVRYTLLSAGRQLADNELTVEWRFL